MSHRFEQVLPPEEEWDRLKTTPLVFLDIDGVMSSNDSWKINRDYRQFGRVHVRCLNGITRKRRAEIVITSCRRFIHDFSEMQELACGFGVTAPIIGYTPMLWCENPETKLVESVKPRSLEIQHWLDSVGRQATRMVILDDESMKHLAPWLVRTETAHGLRPEHIEPAIKNIECKELKIPPKPSSPSRPQDGDG